MDSLKEIKEYMEYVLHENDYPDRMELFITAVRRMNRDIDPILKDIRERQLQGLALSSEEYRTVVLYTTLVATWAKKN